MKATLPASGIGGPEAPTHNNAVVQGRISLSLVARRAMSTPQCKGKSAPSRSRFCNSSESTEPRRRRSGLLCRCGLPSSAPTVIASSECEVHSVSVCGNQGRRCAPLTARSSGLFIPPVRTCSARGRGDLRRSRLSRARRSERARIVRCRVPRMACCAAQGARTSQAKDVRFFRLLQ